MASSVRSVERSIRIEVTRRQIEMFERRLGSIAAEDAGEWTGIIADAIESILETLRTELKELESVRGG